MDMESSRRSLDRSRAPVAKKPKLTGEINGGLKFPQRQTGSSSARFQSNGRNSDGIDSGHGGAGADEYEPQPLPHQELVAQYKTALADLTFNHKPIITNLTIIAGENIPASRSIAGVVCDNILEVPREQKLPSLYLLDSIVKNIGRDYKKYFAARLPEVFLKAYRQVDPSVQSSMRHLFGTWKKVFPPQTLQIIEEELGFTSAVNGPPHSIHVNPKYLERQRLQQSSGTKGGVDDMTGAILNSNKDSERPVRVLGAARPWLDPRRNMHINQHVHRDAFNDSGPERSIGGPFGGNESRSGISSNSGLGVGRNDNRLIGGVAETSPSQRNEFSLKHGLYNHETPKSMISNVHHQSTQAITDIRSGNWKNSEEEEFIWDEMNSGLTDNRSNISSNLSADPWMADDENLDGEDHLQITHPFGKEVDREISTVKKQIPASGGHSSSSWQLQQPHSSTKLNLKPGHSEGFVSNVQVGNLRKSQEKDLHRPPSSVTSFQPRLQQQKLGPSHTDVTLNTKKPPQSKVSLAREASVKSTTNLSAVSVKAGIIPGKSIASSLPSQSVLRPARSGGPSLTTIIPPRKASQPQRDSAQPPASPTVNNASVMSSNTTNKKTVNPIENLFSSLVSKGLISAKTESATTVPSEVLMRPEDQTENIATRDSTQPPASSNVDNASVMSSNTTNTKTLNPFENLFSSLVAKGLISAKTESATIAPSEVLMRPEDQTENIATRDSTQPPASSNVNSVSVMSSNTTDMKTLNPIENLFSSLVAKGLISAKTESATTVPSEVLMQPEDQTENIATSSSLPVASVTGSAGVPVLSSIDDVDVSAKASQSTITEIKDLIGFDFKPELIREMHPHVIRGLMDDLPHHCRICGVRLKQQEQFNRHLEWHATREKEQTGLIMASRRWYAKSNDWIGGKSEYPSEIEFTDSIDVHDKKTDGSQWDTMVLADENQCLCAFCGELFEDVYCQERDQWMFKGAIYLNNSDSKSEMESRNVDPIVHARCLSENSISNVTNTEQCMINALPL